MEIIVRRDDQDYGPYSVSVAQQYLAIGRLKPGDFARLKGEPPTAHRSLASILSVLVPPPKAAAQPVAPTPAPVPAPARPVAAAPATPPAGVKAGPAKPPNRAIAPRPATASPAKAAVKPRSAAPPVKSPSSSPGFPRLPRFPSFPSFPRFSGGKWFPKLPVKLHRYLPRSRASRVTAALLLLSLLVCLFLPRRHDPRADPPAIGETTLPEAAVLPAIGPPRALSATELQIVQDADAFAIGLGSLRDITLIDFVRLMRNPDGHSRAGEPLWKARCIFCWIAQNIAYDEAAVRHSRRRDHDPDAVLRTRLAVCEGYAALFTSLCETANVEAITISGNLHEDREDIGRPIAPDDVGHAWNAAKVGDRWILVDATLAAGSVGNGRFVRSYESAWFDCPPEIMIRSHLPTEDLRQFLPHPVPRRVFEQLPVVRPRFFRDATNAGDLTAGTLPAATPFLRLSLRRDVDLIARVVTPAGRGIDATIDRHSNPREDTDRVDVLLPPGPTHTAYVELLTHAPTEPARTYSLAAIYRVDGAAAVPSAATAVPAPSSEAAADPHALEPTFFIDYRRRHARLEAPMGKELPAGSSQHFRIVVPGAHNVRVVQGIRETFLHRSIEDTFEGNALVDHGPCGLYAVFEEGASEAVGLVEFEGR